MVSKPTDSHFKTMHLCCVRFAETQEASDGADVEDSPGGSRREGAGEAKPGLPRLGLSVLPEPR